MALWLIILIAVLAVVVVGVLVFLGVWFLYVPARYKKQVSDCQDRLTKCGSLLDSDIKALMGRLQYLSQNSQAYYDRYSHESDTLKKLQTESLVKAQEAVSGLDNLLSSKNRKAIARGISEAGATLSGFEKEIETFRVELSNILARDSSYHQKIQPYKEKLRDFKSFITAHELEVRPVLPVLNTFFNGLDRLLEEYDTDLDKGEYGAADGLFRQIVTLIDMVTKYGQDLPEMVPYVNDVLPQKLASVYQEYLTLENGGLPLYHLNVKETLQGMAEQDTEIRKAIEAFNLVGQKEKLEAIKAGIAALEESFAKEQKAREEFQEVKANYGRNVAAIQDEFKTILAALPSWQAEYVIDPTYLNKFMGLDQSIEDMLNKKSDLDTCINSSLETPYTLLMDKSHKLHDVCNDIAITIRSFKDYLERLSKDRDACNQGVNDIHVALWKEDAKVRDIKVPAFISAYETQMEHICEELSEIRESLANKPSDVPHAKAVYTKACDEVNKLIADADAKIDLSRKAETLFVYGNQFRRGLKELDNALKDAELSFDQGDFAAANETATQAIKAIQIPDEEPDAKGEITTSQKTKPISRNFLSNRVQSALPEAKKPELGESSKSKSLISK